MKVLRLLPCLVAMLLLAAGCRSILPNAELVKFRLCHEKNAEFGVRKRLQPDLEAPAGYRWDKVNGTPCLVSADPVLQGMIADAVEADAQGFPAISLSFTDEGCKAFEQLTAANIQRQLAVEIDGKIYCTPRIAAPIVSGRIQVIGFGTTEECKMLVTKLKNAKR